MEALEKILYPITSEEFFKEYWGKKMLHISRTNQAYYDDFLNQDDLDEWLQKTTLKYPKINMLEPNGGRIPPKRWTKHVNKRSNETGRIVDVRTMLQLFSEGYTMIIKEYSNEQYKLHQVMNSLKEIFPGAFDDYLVVSPPGTHAFAIHEDCEDVIVMQIGGKKKWFIYDTLSTNLQKERVNYPITLQPSCEVTLRSGDFLYVPSNLRHSTIVEGEEVSISLSTIIELFRGADFIKMILDDTFISQPSIRNKIIPNHYFSQKEREEYFQKIKKLFIDHLEEVDFEEILHQMILRERHKKGGVRLDDLTQRAIVTLESNIERDQKIPYVLSSDNKVIHLKFLDEIVTYHKTLETTLKYLIFESTFFVKNLPGMLNDKMRVQIVQELVDKEFLKVG